MHACAYLRIVSRPGAVRESKKSSTTTAYDISICSWRRPPPSPPRPNPLSASHLISDGIEVHELSFILGRWPPTMRGRERGHEQRGGARLSNGGNPQISGEKKYTHTRPPTQRVLRSMFMNYLLIVVSSIRALNSIKIPTRIYIHSYIPLINTGNQNRFLCNGLLKCGAGEEGGGMNCPHHIKQYKHPSVPFRFTSRSTYIIVFKAHFRAVTLAHKRSRGIHTYIQYIHAFRKHHQIDAKGLNDSIRS